MKKETIEDIMIMTPITILALIDKDIKIFLAGLFGLFLGYIIYKIRTHLKGDLK